MDVAIFQCIRFVLARECAITVLQRMDEGAVHAFVETLGNKLDDIHTGSLGSKMSYSKQKEKMWTQFYKYRASELVSSWKAFVAQANLPPVYNDPWLIQVVARLSLEKCIVTKHPTASPSCASEKKRLTADEHNALRYSAGYVMASLAKRYDAAGSPSLARWVRDQSEVSSAPTSSFFHFTKVWVEKVNRGGLFLVNDSLYDVFHSVELILSEHLRSMPADQGLDKSKILSLLCEDNEVQFLWSTLVFDLDEESSQKVLMDIVRLWVTVRGFSYASALVEEYKRVVTGALQRTKSLRKELKKKSSDSAEQ